MSSAIHKKVKKGKNWGGKKMAQKEKSQQKILLTLSTY